MSGAAAGAIVREREPAHGGPYRSLADFCGRTRVSIEVVENLVRVGALDGLGARREELLAHVPLVHAQVLGTPAGAHGAARGRGRGRAPAPAPPPGPEPLRLATGDELVPLPFLPSWSASDRLAAELDILGLNVSGHPLATFRDELERLGAVPFGRLQLVPDGRRVRLAGVLERAQMPWIRSGHRTLFLTLEDETGLAEVVVFNDVYLRFGRILKEALYLLVEGELQNNDERGLAIVAHRIADLETLLGRGRDSSVTGTTGGGGLPPDQRAAALRRSGEWLPQVEPRTRPGRTG